MQVYLRIFVILSTISTLLGMPSYYTKILAFYYAAKTVPSSGNKALKLNNIYRLV